MSALPVPKILALDPRTKYSRQPQAVAYNYLSIAPSRQSTNHAPPTSSLVVARP